MSGVDGESGANPGERDGDAEPELLGYVAGALLSAATRYSTDFLSKETSDTSRNSNETDWKLLFSKKPMGS